MRQVTVYQVDYVRKTKVPVGTVTERRTVDRPDNVMGLLRLARKLYATTPTEAFRIVIDMQEARFG
jgi:hypothetical protein